MRCFIYGLLVIVVLPMQLANAEITLGYPGPLLENGTAPIIEVVGDTDVKSGVFKLVIGPFYKFTFTGIETYGNVAVGEGDGDGGNPIHFSAIIKVDGPGSSDENPEGTENTDYLAVSMFNSSERFYTILENEIVYRANGSEPLYLEVTWSTQIQGGNSNTVTPDGHFNIMGYSQADPLPPSGSLHIPTGDYAVEGSFPVLEAIIVRE
jgi:hypothetical protein